MSLIERAKQDAKAREKEKKQKEHAKREQGKAEFEEVTEKAAEFVSRKLDTEISADQLRHQEQTWLDGDLAWDLTVEGMEFEVSRNMSGTVALYLMPADEDGQPRYIRRLADLAEGGSSDE